METPPSKDTNHPYRKLLFEAHSCILRCQVSLRETGQFTSVDEDRVRNAVQQLNNILNQQHYQRNREYFNNPRHAREPTSHGVYSESDC